MVICTYFLSNTCRFGTKCHNEHVNVKLTVKTDAEGALKGNQWPLSSYGPFRDKPSVSNFIEDQSFEEVRYKCYEAKASGNVQMVTMEFKQSVMDAKNKLNIITNPTDDVVALVTNLYNSNCPNTSTPNSNANSFGMGTNSMSTNSMGNNIFGGGNNTNNNVNNNLFGSSNTTTSSNPFARNAAGFGAPPQNQTPNLFGASSTGASTNMNLFGGNSSTTSNNLFGSSSFSNSNATSTFGSTNQPTSLFGGGASGTSMGPFSQASSNASPFALSTPTNQSTNVFGSQAQQSNPIFGGNAMFGNQVKTGLFGQANATLAQPTNTGNIFGQNVQAPAFGAPAQTNVFGNATQNQSQSIFGGQQQTMQMQDNPFAAASQSQTNIFGNAQMQQQQEQQQQVQPSPFQSSGNAFGNAANMSMGQSIFGASQANANQMAPVPASSQTLQQQQQSIFGTNSFAQQPATAAPPAFGGNIFENSQDAQRPATQPLFGSQAQPQQQNVFAAQPIQQSKTLYTPMESLSAEEIEAFKSTTFNITNIPTKPPPMELCT